VRQEPEEQEQPLDTDALSAVLDELEECQRILAAAKG
jgi:hypothetical protein